MQNFDARTPTPAHETAIDCLQAGVEAVLPDRVVRESVSLDGDALTVADETYDLTAYDRILVVGGAKPATASPTPSKPSSATASTTASW